MSDQGVEAVTRRARILACTDVELTAELEAFYSASVVVYLDDVASVQVPEYCTALFILLSEVLAVDGYAVRCTCPDADLQVV